MMKKVICIHVYILLVERTSRRHSMKRARAFFLGQGLNLLHYPTASEHVFLKWLTKGMYRFLFVKTPDRYNLISIKLS